MLGLSELMLGPFLSKELVFSVCQDSRNHYLGHFLGLFWFVEKSICSGLSGGTGHSPKTTRQG